MTSTNVDGRLSNHPLVAAALIFAVMVALGCMAFVAAHHLLLAVAVWAAFVFVVGGVLVAYWLVVGALRLGADR